MRISFLLQQYGLVIRLAVWLFLDGSRMKPAFAIFFAGSKKTAAFRLRKKRQKSSANCFRILRREAKRQSAGNTQIPGAGHHGYLIVLRKQISLCQGCITGPLKHGNQIVFHRRILQGDDLIDTNTAQSSVNVGEAADAGGRNQLLVDLALIAAAVAAHQQHASLFSQLRQTISNVIALNQHVAVVEEEHHTDNVSTVDALFHLGDDHVFQNLSGVGGFKQVSDFHSNSPYK